jgi:mannose-6-phosphate isomerase-like protein (cupin superfamily)
MERYTVRQLNQIDPTECPCGFSRRAFMTGEPDTASVHLLDVSGAARTHYHKRLTEIYVILAGRGRMELDGQVVPIQPLTAVLIQPGCRHRAIGTLKILNIVIPRFDPADEWFPADEGP